VRRIVEATEGAAPLTIQDKDLPTGAALATDDERAAARKRIEAKRGFVSNLVAYLVINAFLILMRAATGAGYFWPGWVLGGWGAALVLHAWDTFGRAPVTDADIDAEVRRRRR
jgi:hypothetical protein